MLAIDAALVVENLLRWPPLRARPSVLLLVVEDAQLAQGCSVVDTSLHGHVLRRFLRVDLTDVLVNVQRQVSASEVSLQRTKIGIVSNA